MSTPPRYYPTLDNVRDPIRLLADLQRVYNHLYALEGRSPTLATTSALSRLPISKADLEFIRANLQLSGSTPINITNLIGGSGTSVSSPLADTHANRLSSYPASSYPAGTLFFETDRTLTYVNLLVSGTLTWTYLSGIGYAVLASAYSGLGVADTNLLFFATDYFHLYRWTGAAFVFAPADDGSGYFRWDRTTPNMGLWQICDGTAVNVAKADATGTTSVTTPNATGSYLKVAASYNVTPQAAVAPGISGSTASESAHTHSINPPNTTSGDGSNHTVTVDPGAISTVSSSSHTNDVDIAAFTSGVGSAHLHAAGTLAVDATGQPLHLDTQLYLRR